MTEPELLPAQSASESTTKASSKSESAPKNEQTQRSRAGLWLVLLINFLLICTLVGGAAWFWLNFYEPLQQRVETQQLNNNALVSVQSAQTRQLSDLNTLEQAITDTQNNLNGVAASTQVLSKQLSTLEQAVSAQGGARASDWLVAEADYLIRMAGRKLWLESDTRTAVKLLEEADKRLEETSDPALFPARSSIASDIQRIEQVNPVSTTSVALSISGLLASVDNLPLNALQLPESQTQGPAPVSEDVKDWRQNLSRIWDALMDDFVTVRRRAEPVEPMMTQAQEFLAKERVKLSLMQAQSAALNNQVTLYQQSLQQAVAGLVEHFELQHHQVEQFLQAIANLQSTNVEKALPETLAAQDALQKALARREQNTRSGSLSL